MDERIFTALREIVDKSMTCQHELYVNGVNSDDFEAAVRKLQRAHAGFSRAVRLEMEARSGKKMPESAEEG